VKFIPLFLVAALIVGCQATDQASQKKLLEGKQALDQKQFDTAISRADAVLQAKADNVSTAGAYYLRGRALWQRPKANQAAWEDDLQQAKVNYNRALELAPPAGLDGYIRVSLASVYFAQNDFANAYDQYSKAYDKLSEPEIKSGVLYRIGVCQQRLGHYDDADKVLGMLLNQFPSSYEAPRARERMGIRGFTVQLATFHSLKTADEAVQELKKQGVNATRSSDPRSNTVVKVGPVSYNEAVGIKARFASKYPDAIILP
jgi:tetratricopeptide (TPR) repeat protein